MFRRRRTTPIDVNRIASAAADAFLAPEGHSQNAHDERHQSGSLRSMGAVAVGVALALAARAAYSRARTNLDLEQVADAVEERLTG